MSDNIKLGTQPTDRDGRDAVHVAIIARKAIRRMMPGEKLKYGVVDPFLTTPVESGEWYWLCLYPDTVTSLRHVWTAAPFLDEPEMRVDNGF